MKFVVNNGALLKWFMNEEPIMKNQSLRPKWLILLGFSLGMLCFLGPYYFGFLDGNAMNHSCTNGTIESKSTGRPGWISRLKRASNDKIQKPNPEDLCSCWYQYAFTITVILYLLSFSGMSMCFYMAMIRRD